MKKNKKVAIISSILALSLLSGCGHETKIETIDGREYIKNGDEYVEVLEKTQIFEPGTHFIQYYNFVGSRDGWYRYGYESGFVDNSNVPVIEGYEIYNVEPVLYDGYTYGYMYIFVNNQRVEAQATYDYNNNTYYYANPGIVIEEHKLS